MTVRVRLFAGLRERAGTSELSIELPEGALVGDALERLAWLTRETSVVMAVNREYAAPGDPLAAEDELALIPPVSGGSAEAGSSRVHARVTGEALSHDTLVELVRDPRAGAIVTFTGTTRDVDALDYEAYEEMAERQLRRIAQTALARHQLCAAAVEHRVGNVALSQPSVIVAVSAAHRDEAFAGAREIIDEVKANAPIWKREEDSWVEEAVPSGESREARRPG